MEKKIPSGSCKRKRKLEILSQNKKLPKINSFFQAMNCNESNDINSDIEIVDANKETEIGEINCSDTLNESQTTDAMDVELSDTSKIITYDFPTDINNFKTELSVENKCFIIENGPCQPTNIIFQKTKDGFSFNISYYQKIAKSGLKIPRTWLCYSPSLNINYCQMCWLFGDHTCNKKWVTGFTDWKHALRAIERHEMSNYHSESCKSHNIFIASKTVNASLMLEIKNDTEYWTAVLDRVVRVTLTLAMNDIPFRGHRENLDSPNKGKVLAIIELLSKYDPVLDELLKKKSGRITYLSHNIQNEIINTLGSKVKRDIITDIQAAPFWSYIADSTVDVSKVDQLSEIYRYVEIKLDDKNVPVAVKIHESFSGFQILEGQKSSEMENQMYATIEKNELQLSKLRGLGFDGAANMAGAYSGLQARIHEKYKLATYVHCATHNLNLVINDSVANITKIVIFYDNIQSLYLFFSNSIHRWSLLKTSTTIRLVLKKLCATRWTSRNDSISALRYLYKDVLLMLTYLSLEGRDAKERDQAKALNKYFEKFETIVILVLESRVLSYTNTVSKVLQSPEVDLSVASVMLGNALNNIKLMRYDSYFMNSVLKTAEDLAASWGVVAKFENKRSTLVPRHFDELISDQRLLDPLQHFKTQVYFATLDKIILQLTERFAGLNKIVKTFECIQPAYLANCSEDNLEVSSKLLCAAYEDDLSPSLTAQIIILKNTFTKELNSIKTVHELSEFLIVKNHGISSSFPDVITACILFLTIPVTVASAERSFSKLKIIKNYLRSTMSQSRLSNLALLSIEKEKRASKLDTKTIIKEFAAQKARKKSFKT